MCTSQIPDTEVILEAKILTFEFLIVIFIISAVTFLQVTVFAKKNPCITLTVKQAADSTAVLCLYIKHFALSLSQFRFFLELLFSITAF